MRNFEIFSYEAVRKEALGKNKPLILAVERNAMEGWYRFKAWVKNSGVWHWV